MKTIYLMIILTLILPFVVFSQTSLLVSAVSNFGNYGEPNSSLPSGEYPCGSDKYYLWEGRYWVGAVIDGERHVSHADYGNYEWKPANSAQMQYHVLGEGNFIDSVQYSDIQPMSGHFPMGLLVHQSAQAFPTGEGPDEAFLIEQIVVNDGSYFLDSVYIAWVFDCDIAAGAGGWLNQPNIDDWASYQPERSMGYMWDGDNPEYPGDDTGDFGVSPGYIGIALLDAPLPLCSFQWWNWEEDPGTDDEKFQFMAGIHPASGGLAFRADPDSVFDYRILISTGPYTLNPGDSIYTAMTFAVGIGMDGLNNSIDEMIEYYENLSYISQRENPVRNCTLLQAYPNPFNESAILSFELNNAGNVSLSIFDIQGREILQLIDGYKSAGKYEILMDLHEMGSGIYFARLIGNNSKQIIKLVYLK